MICECKRRKNKASGFTWVFTKRKKGGNKEGKKTMNAKTVTDGGIEKGRIQGRLEIQRKVCVIVLLSAE